MDSSKVTDLQGKVSRHLHNPHLQLKAPLRIVCRPKDIVKVVQFLMGVARIQAVLLLVKLDMEEEMNPCPRIR